MLRKIQPETRTHDLLAPGLAPLPTELDTRTIIIPASIRYKSNQVGGRMEKVWGCAEKQMKYIYLFRRIFTHFFTNFLSSLLLRSVLSLKIPLPVRWSPELDGGATAPEPKIILKSNLFTSNLIIFTCSLRIRNPKFKKAYQSTGSERQTAATKSSLLSRSVSSCSFFLFLFFFCNFGLWWCVCDFGCCWFRFGCGYWCCGMKVNFRDGFAMYFLCVMLLMIFFLLQWWIFVTDEFFVPEFYFFRSLFFSIQTLFIVAMRKCEYTHMNFQFFSTVRL
jgi:hypothetical protein